MTGRNTHVIPACQSNSRANPQDDSFAEEFTVNGERLATPVCRRALSCSELDHSAGCIRDVGDGSPSV